MNSKSHLIKSICHKLLDDKQDSAKNAITQSYPHEIEKKDTRKISENKALEIFIRDSFIDRYTGTKLIFPGTLRVISHYFPIEFPYHRNWKMDECHIAYWELYPTLDHIIPIARGGYDVDENIVTTSMLTNYKKANFTIDEMNWDILPVDHGEDWDGLTSLFSELVNKDKSLLEVPYIAKWNRNLEKSGY